MQHYLEHIRQSRQRLRHVVGKLSRQETSVFIRGTVLHENSIYGVPKNQDDIATPVYAGNLGSRSPEVENVLLDASLRKSISFALDHFRSVSCTFARSAIDALVSSEQQMVGVPIPVLFLTHNGYTVYDGLCGGRYGLQFAYVGTEIISTFLDTDLRRYDLECLSEKSKIYSVSLPLPELVRLAKVAIQKDVIEETERFMKLKHSAKMINQQGNFRVVPQFIHDGVYEVAGDISISVEGFKRRFVANPLREFYIGNYRFSIEVEMVMMNQMLQALEE